MKLKIASKISQSLRSIRWALVAILSFSATSLQLEASDSAAKNQSPQLRNAELVLDAKYRSLFTDADFMILEFMVTEMGDVRSPKVLASTKPQFSESVLLEVAKWEFEAGQKEIRVRQRIEFQ